MKKIFMAVVVAGFALAGMASAQMGMMGNYQASTTVVQASNANISAALQDIYKSQKISSQSQIDCAKITDSQFEKLGDASMGYGITEEQHTAMENMMGGEGSATLRQAHINMGRSYLGCWANYSGAPSMMGQNMMGSFGQGSSVYPYSGSMMGWGSAMNGYYGGYLWFHWVTMILVWILLIVVILILAKRLKNK